MHLSGELGAHPRSDFGASPYATIGSRAFKRFVELGTQGRRQERSLTRVVMAAVADVVRTISIVTADNRVQPGQRVATELCDFGWGTALAQQPEHLPMTASHRIGGLAIALPELLNRQMVNQFQSSHAVSIHPYLVSHASMASS